MLATTERGTAGWCRRSTNWPGLSWPGARRSECLRPVNPVRIWEIATGDLLAETAVAEAAL